MLFQRKKIKKYEHRLLGVMLSATLLVSSFTVTLSTGFGINMMETSAEEVTADEVPADEIAAVKPLSAASAVLMEASTGKLVYAQSENEERSPASITKIMTMLLTFDALKAGKIKLEDEVCTSAYAKSMGGSQVFLEEGELQTVETLIKCVAVASGNDAAVALAEHISGSEEAFVEKMNEKAKELGLTHTHFVDCCGLTDDDAHHTSALDVAKMSRELICKYPQVFDYTGIWMEDIKHVTTKGESTFTLSSTNKLLKQYPYTTGLKTGSTSKAGYCFSATASKDRMQLIAVVMGAPDPKTRFSEAKDLLCYGYGVCKLYEDNNRGKVQETEIAGALEKTCPVTCDETFSYVDVTGADLSKVQKTYTYHEELTAPVKKGDEAGNVIYSLNGKEIGSVPILVAVDVDAANFTDYLKKVVMMWIL